MNHPDASIRIAFKGGLGCLQGRIGVLRVGWVGYQAVKACRRAAVAFDVEGEVDAKRAEGDRIRRVTIPSRYPGARSLE